MIEISILMNELCYEYSCEIKKMLEKGCTKDDLTSVTLELNRKVNHLKEISNEFNEIIESIMDYEDDKSISFNDYFTVMLKTSIINSNVPIFDENIGKAFNEYSYREVKLRISFEHKETMLNSNRMKMMLPVMAKTSIL